MTDNERSQQLVFLKVQQIELQGLLRGTEDHPVMGRSLKERLHEVERQLGEFQRTDPNDG